MSAADTAPPLTRSTATATSNRGSLDPSSHLYTHRKDTLTPSRSNEHRNCSGLCAITNEPNRVWRK